MLELILPALAGGGLLWGRHGFKRRRRLQGWRQALEMCGLEVEESAGTWTPRRLMLKGKAGPLEIRIESMGDDKKGARLAVLVPGPADFSQVKIRRELHGALTDMSPQIRLCAAKEMGEAGRHVLLALAALKKDDALSAEAVTVLGRDLSFERVSLAEAEAGQLSLAVDPAGQLSISGGKELS